MKKEQLKELKKIRDNAPEGAFTLYSYTYDYGSRERSLFLNVYNKYYDIAENKWCEFTYGNNLLNKHRSLDDIKLIIEQAERIEQLERESLELTALCCMICDLNECEQDSEDFENTYSELINRALTILGRTDT